LNLRNWQLQEMARKELDWAKKTLCVSWSDSEKSVARIRLMKTENSSAYATVNCKVCRIAIALYLPGVPTCVNV
jgi:hypothetical protein